mgnify:CR=1 FL=1
MPVRVRPCPRSSGCARRTSSWSIWCGPTRSSAKIGTFDTGAWSLYSRGAPSTHESDLGYHTLLRDFLKQLGQYYEIVIYTDEQPVYADPILNALDGGFKRPTKAMQ